MKKNYYVTPDDFVNLITISFFANKLIVFKIASIVLTIYLILVNGYAIIAAKKRFIKYKDSTNRDEIYLVKDKLTLFGIFVLN